QHRGDPDRADAPARYRRGRGGAARACDGAAGEGRPVGGRAEPVPARVFRRAAPAHRNRPRADPEARAADLRRSSVGPGRLDSGTALESAAGAPGRDRNELSLHLARPRRGQAHGGRGDGDEGWRNRGARSFRGDICRSEAPLYSCAARFGPPMRFLFLLLMFTTEAWAAHAYSQFGDIKYPAGFKHFEWVNPDAPKGGDLDLVPPLRITNFDKYNPFTLKGTAPPGLGALVFESLLTGTMDEPTTAYGLLAEDVAVATDGLSVTFRLNRAAKFQDGTPVLAADVKHSFDTLMSKQAAPQYRVVFADVKQAVVLNERTVR